MLSIARHTIAFGRVFTLLFFFANSDFTSLLHICSMEACEYYGTSGTSDNDACPNKQVPAPIAGMSIQNVNDCYDATVGGFAIDPALVKEVSKEQNIEVLILLTSAFVSPVQSNCSSSFNYSYSESVSPPSVKKYVLNATFLI